MRKQSEQAQLLADLHTQAEPLILFNIWDAGSAKAIQDQGAKVIATSSWAVAAAHGYQDGEQLPFDLVLANLKRIIQSTSLPVTLDLEGGYSQSLKELQVVVEQVIQAGVVGINFEDQIIGSKGFYSIAEQCLRIKTIREVAKQMSLPLFINARNDIFFQVEPHQHNAKHLEEALKRVEAYAEAGANGFFVPGLQDNKLIKKLCQLSPLPINIMLLDNKRKLQQLAALGVARISYGPSLYCRAMQGLVS